MRDSIREFPPYEGDSPYLYFAFAEADSRKVREYLRLLYERGCRVWYSCGKADGPEEVLRRQARYRGAALTLVYLSDEACRDQNTKSSVLVNQKFDSPIICLDPDGKDRVLAMGLRESVPHIPLYRIRGREALEDAIFHAEGFSQELLGEPVKVRKDSILPKLSLLFCALAVVLSVLFFTGVRESVTEVIQITDEDSVFDAVYCKEQYDNDTKNMIESVVNILYLVVMIFLAISVFVAYISFGCIFSNKGLIISCPLSSKISFTFLFDFFNSLFILSLFF